MKKFLRKILILIFLIVLICLVKKLDILDFSVFTSSISEEELSNYTGFYFDKLEKDEKEIYIRMDKAVANKKEEVFLAFQAQEDLTQKVTKVITAYFYDNPEKYNISNEYVIYTKDLKIVQYSMLKLKYITNDPIVERSQKEQFEIVINEILAENIYDGMTDFEKQLALHDALVRHINYYKYEDISTIPASKHTAYGALVEKEAVCDGYSKAYKILLDRAGIENIIVNGTTNNLAHAWSMVKLEDKYYHVDVTSDKLEKGNRKYVIHTYFNVTDDEIGKTHSINRTFEYPTSTESKYNYYMEKGCYIKNNENLYSRLKKIISSQKERELLEIRVGNEHSADDIIDELYYLNFNNWRSSGKTNVEYNKAGDVYIFVK